MPTSPSRVLAGRVGPQVVRAAFRASRLGRLMVLPEQRVVPTLRITDHERGTDSDIEKLGFAVEWEHRFGPHFPLFRSVVRGGMRVYLSQHAWGCQVGGLVHFLIEDVDAWHAEFGRRGGVVVEAPKDELAFRKRTIRGPDDNQLRFMVPASEAAPRPTIGERRLRLTEGWASRVARQAGHAVADLSRSFGKRTTSSRPCRPVRPRRPAAPCRTWPGSGPRTSPSGSGRTRSRSTWPGRASRTSRPWPSPP